MTATNSVETDVSRFGAMFAAAAAASEGAQPLAACGVLVAGMGGSGIAGRLAQALEPEATQQRRQHDGGDADDVGMLGGFHGGSLSRQA